MLLKLNFRIYFLVVFIFLSSFSFSQSEEVKSFHSDIEVLESGEISVTESIEIYANGNVFRRGIYRSLPYKRKDPYGRTIRDEYKVKSVLRNGKKSPYHIEREGVDFVIYVGEEDFFIPDGIHNYQIQYSLEGQIRYFEDFDEIYWNVNGFDWTVPVNNVTASVKLPNNVEAIQSACYTGRRNSTQSDCTTFNDVSNINFSYNSPGYGNNLTVAVGFPKGVVAAPPPPKPPTFFEKYGAQILTLLVGGIMMLYYFFTWRKFGVDPPKPTVYPQFEVPDNLSPASIGMIKQGRYSSQFITASIVDLAVKGYLEIIEEEKGIVRKLLFGGKKFALQKLKNSDEQLPIEERHLLRKLFTGGATKVSISGNYNSTIASVVDAYRLNIKGQWSKLLNQGNNYKFLLFPILFAGFYFICFLVLIPYFRVENVGLYLLGFLFTNFLLFLIYQWLIKKPSEKKLELRSQIKGFEMYLNAAEERQIQTFNPPKITPEIFEKYLPYAMVLGAEKVWGKTFQRMLDRSSQYKDYNPSWTNHSSTNLSSFGHGFNQSFTKSLANTTTAPSSSGSSGSGGGGFSGGGGGGGGGGGW